MLVLFPSRDRTVETHLGLSCAREPTVLNTWLALGELYSVGYTRDLPHTSVVNHTPRSGTKNTGILKRL
jgi:hypothetical protein